MCKIASIFLMIKTRYLTLANGSVDILKNSPAFCYLNLKLIDIFNAENTTSALFILHVVPTYTLLSQKNKYKIVIFP